MKKVKTFKGWSIYETTDRKYNGMDSDNPLFLVYLPEESPREFFSPEFECQSIQECIDNIKSY